MAARVQYSLGKVLRELRRKANFTTAQFTDFKCGDFHINICSVKPGPKELTEAIK